MPGLAIASKVSFRLALFADVTASTGAVAISSHWVWFYFVDARVMQ